MTYLLEECMFNTHTYTKLLTVLTVQEYIFLRYTPLSVTPGVYISQIYTPVCDTRGVYFSDIHPCL